MCFIKPASSKEKCLLLVSIIWSIRFISNIEREFLIFAVKSRSQSLGFRFPEGWLWEKIMFLALPIKAICAIIRISTAAKSKPPCPTLITPSGFKAEFNNNKYASSQYWILSDHLLLNISAAAAPVLIVVNSDKSTFGL